MKATVDLPENLLAEVRIAAEKRGWTVRVVFEESLRAFLERDAAQQKAEPFRLAHTVVKGNEPPAMTFSDMLTTSNPDRWPATEGPER